MAGGTIDSRGAYIQITVPAAEAQSAIDRIQATGKYQVVKAWSDESGYHIGIFLGFLEQATCFEFLKQELGLVDRTD